MDASQKSKWDEGLIQQPSSNDCVIQLVWTSADGGGGVEVPTNWFPTSVYEDRCDYEPYFNLNPAECDPNLGEDPEISLDVSTSTGLVDGIEVQTADADSQVSGESNVVSGPLETLNDFISNIIDWIKELFK